jgi:hypothetical protein
MRLGLKKNKRVGRDRSRPQASSSAPVAPLPSPLPSKSDISDFDKFQCPTRVTRVGWERERAVICGGSKLQNSLLLHLARASANQMPPPIMKPPETRDSARVRRAEKIERARPDNSAYIASVMPAITMKVTPSSDTCEK